MTIINLNGKKYKTTTKTLKELKKELNINKTTYVLVNGTKTCKNKNLYNNISVSFIKKNSFVSLKEYNSMMSCRYGKETFNKIKSAQVAVAGLGGIGSNVAIMLARTGIGKLFLVDFDKVDVSNLNRQHYFIEQLGSFKTKALKEQIKKINPFVKVKTKNIFIKEENIKMLFYKYKIICEGFDKAQNKAMFINTILTKLPESYIIASNGMAGYSGANDIKTVKKTKKLYVCGDFKNEVNENNSLYATRVQVCAAHVANIAVRLVLGITEE